MNTKNVLIIDSTLRDGSHAIGHQLTEAQVSSYAAMAETTGIPILMVGHGNGLGASSLQLGLSNCSDKTLLLAAKKHLHQTKLGAFLIPGYGTIRKDIIPAIEVGIQVMMIASHCSEANVTRQHIQFCRNQGIETYGVLMMSHMISADSLVEQAKLMESYGAEGILLMDSAGSYLLSDVKKKVSLLVANIQIPVGFHAHNNLGLAVANAVMAVESGASIIDATSHEFGAGAGNCQLEVIVPVLEKMGYQTKIDLYKLLDMSEYVAKELMQKAIDISSVTLISGLAGVFSGFAPHVIKASEQFGVDVKDIFMELGKRGVVGGQEDIIIDVAMNLKQKKASKQLDAQIASLT